MQDPSVTIIVRSFNEGWALKDTLAALHDQDYTAWKLIVIDSGSTDDSVELIRRAKPKHFIQISPDEYHPPKVLNMGMRLSETEYNIFLNADATPQGTNWLRPLVHGLIQKDVAAVYGRQIPRPNCLPVFAHDYERCFRTDSSAGWGHFFSMVSSGIKKSIWSIRGFSEKMHYSEDDEYTRWCVSQGWKIKYCPDSVVVHSHNYSAEQTKKRQRGEGEALALMAQEYSIRMDWWHHVGMGFVADSMRDLGYCFRKGRFMDWPHALRIRALQRTARYQGFRHGLKRLLTGEATFQR